MKKIATFLLTAVILNSAYLMGQSYSPTYSPSYPSGSSYYQPGNTYSSQPWNQQYQTPSYPQSQPSYSPTPQSSNQINWLRSYSDAVSMSQSQSKPIAILFTGTSWCPACMKLERSVLNHPEFIRAVSQKFVFLKAEFNEYSEQAVMASPYKPLLDRYGVNSFPTIVVVNSNGQQLFRVSYKEGGPMTYAQEMLQRLNQGGGNAF